MLKRELTSQDIEGVLDLANELAWASELLDAKVKERLWWSEELELMADGKIDKCGCGRTAGFRAGLVDAFLGCMDLARVTKGSGITSSAVTNRFTRSRRRDGMIEDQVSNLQTE